MKTRTFDATGKLLYNTFRLLAFIWSTFASRQGIFILKNPQSEILRNITVKYYNKTQRLLISASSYNDGHGFYLVIQGLGRQFRPV